MTDKKVIYTLSHIYEYGEEGNEDVEIKELGIYSTRKNALEAIERYFLLPGFSQYPKECFLIDERLMDVDYGWTEGFVGTDEIAQDFKALTACFNDWLGIEVTCLEDSWKDSAYYNALCRIYGKAYQLKNVEKLAQQIDATWKEYYKVPFSGDKDCIVMAKKILQAFNLI